MAPSCTGARLRGQTKINEKEIAIHEYGMHDENSTVESFFIAKGDKINISPINASLAAWTQTGVYMPKFYPCR